MATRRLAIFLAGALAIGAGAAWVASDLHPVPPDGPTYQVGVAYAVDVQDEEALFDLPFEAGGRYRVIVASLSAQAVESRLTLSAEKIPSVERFPLRPVEQISAIPLVPAAWNSPGAWGDEDSSAEPLVPQTGAEKTDRTFHLHVTDGPLDDARQYAKVRGVLVAEGQFVRVFLDSQMHPGQLAQGLVSEIVRLFDGEIVPGSRDVLGTFRDVDGDGKFAILISPWLGKLQGGKTALGGFVRGSDFQRFTQAPFGNQADVLYLNSNLRPGPHLKTLLAHEYAHAVCFSERLPTTVLPEGLPGEEDWLNEAIAHLAENLHQTGWTNLDHRISRFLDAPDRSPLVVRNYYAGGLWRDPGCRGATYLFLRWVVDQFGEDVLTRLINGRETGVKNLEAATGLPFPELFRGWTIALAQAGQRGKNVSKFSTLELNQRLGRWSLQGPRLTKWNLDEGKQSFSLCGTSAKVFEVSAKSDGIYRLRVRTEGRPQLQVTVIRQPAGSVPPEILARWQTPESPGVQPTLELKMASTGTRVVRVAMECRDGKQGRSVCWEADQLPRPTAGQESEIVLDPPSRMFPGETGTWQVKILTEDAKGRWQGTWIDLPAPPNSVLPIASRPGVLPTRTVDGG